MVKLFSLDTAGQAHRYGLITWTKTLRHSGQIFTPPKISEVPTTCGVSGTTWTSPQFSSTTLSKEACLSTTSTLTNQETNSTICMSTTHMEVFKLEQPTKVSNKETNSRLDHLYWPAVSSLVSKDTALCGAETALLHTNQSRLLLTNYWLLVSVVSFLGVQTSQHFMVSLLMIYSFRVINSVFTCHSSVLTTTSLQRNLLRLTTLPPENHGTNLSAFRMLSAKQSTKDTPLCITFTPNSGFPHNLDIKSWDLFGTSFQLIPTLLV